jgi:hypothetical protein
MDYEREDVLISVHATIGRIGALPVAGYHRGLIADV